MKTTKNITKYEYPRHSFNGYRVRVCRNGIIHERYFSAKGQTWETTFAQALRYRARLYKKLGIKKEGA